MQVWRCTLASLLLIFLTVSGALAKSVDYKYVSLDLPSGWEVKSKPIDDKGAYTVVFGRTDQKASVALLMGETMGESLAVIAEAMSKFLGSSEAPKATKGQYRFPCEKDGIQGNAVIAEDKGKVMLTVLYGDQNEAGKLVKRLKSKTYPDLLPK